MSNKKRKLTKEKEQLRNIRQKHQKKRNSMVWLVAAMALVAITAFAVRLCVIKVGLSTAEICFTAVLSIIAFAGPIFLAFWNNKRIREIDTRMTAKDQQILAWEQRLQDM